MAEEFQLGRGNWWESSTSSSSTTSSSRNKFIDSGISSCTMPSASSTTISSMTSNFVWATEIEDIKARSDNSSMIFPADSHKRYTSESYVVGGGAERDVLFANPNLQMTGLSLPSQGLDWNQPFFRGEKSGSGFRSILQEGLSSNANYQQEGSCHEQDHNWSTQKIFHGNSDDSSVNDYNKQILNRGISLDHQSQVFSGHNLENSAPNYASPSNMLQGLLISDNSQQESNNFTSASRSLYYNPSYNNQSNCDVNIPPTSVDVMPTSSSSSSWSKFPQFLRTSDTPKQQWPLQPSPPPHGQSSHFSGITPFWSATSAAADDVRSGFALSLHPQLPNPMVDEKPKHTSKVRNISTVAKKTSCETSNKRQRNEAPSPLPAFKVRKEKMGDRITALQQLVSPFGKTDTASVLSEAIEYIKFLHEQVNVLSTPYMKSGASMQHQQSGDKSNVNPGGKQDLRSRGLYLVPVSSTFPVTHETTVDFWTPTFGGTFR